MSNDKVRAEFEAWAEDWPVSRYAMRKAVSGEYKDVRIQLAWESWQASRAILAVELPRQLSGSVDFMNGGSEMRRLCWDAIESAGVRVNP